MTDNYYNMFCGDGYIPISNHKAIITYPNPYSEDTPLEETATIIDRDGGFMNPLLYDLLSQPTPHGHEDLIHKYLPTSHKNVNYWKKDELGNIIIRVGNKKNSNTIFSCHMDTAHPVTQTDKTTLIFKNEKCPLVDRYLVKAKRNGKKPNTYTGSVLGGDDKIGVFILSKMIENGISGLYIFHIGEERGCIGSRYIAEKSSDLFAGYKRAIAFDRQGYTDVIAHQRGRRCASKTFTEELAKQLCTRGPKKLMFEGDVQGMYTDTANYTKYIPECSNVSIGYSSQHSAAETVDTLWAEQMLLPSILNVEWEKLPVNHVVEKSVPTTVYSYLGTCIELEDIFDHTPSKHERKRLIKQWLMKSSPYEQKEAATNELFVLLKKLAKLNRTANKNNQKEKLPQLDLPQAPIDPSLGAYTFIYGALEFIDLFNSYEILLSFDNDHVYCKDLFGEINALGPAENTEASRENAIIISTVLCKLCANFTVSLYERNVYGTFDITIQNEMKALIHNALNYMNTHKMGVYVNAGSKFSAATGIGTR